MSDCHTDLVGSHEQVDFVPLIAPHSTVQLQMTTWGEGFLCNTGVLRVSETPV